MGYGQYFLYNGGWRSILEPIMLAVSVKNLSKTYKIYEKPVDRLKEFIFRKPYHQSFSALKNIFVSIEKGESIGIIGANGAGKSTLLKILAGTLRQTEGTVVVNGRVSALLELGAGFHPEFTGRQNISINASLMGLSSDEIRQKEQEIIDFAELGQFIDRPVKTYSSGMYVRLAFSIATTVDPEILIVDEALSVGDQRFQKKCIDKMIQFRKVGKTIIFCSHSVYHITELCERAMWINNGSIKFIGDRKEAISAYDRWCELKQRNELDGAYSESPVKIRRIDILDGSENLVYQSKKGDDIRIRMDLHSIEKRIIHLGVGLQNMSGEIFFGVTTKSDDIKAIEVEGDKRVEIILNRLPISMGSYQAFGVVLDDHALHVYDLKLSDQIQFENVMDTYGKIFIDHSWEVKGT